MHEVVASLRDENVSIAKLAELVRNDAVISAKVLRLANSSYYGAGRNIASIGDAVKLVGLVAFRNRVIASSLVSSFPAIERFDLATFWRESMLVANLAHIIGRELDEGQEMLFSAGLMHGIGQLLLYLWFPQQASELAARIKNAPLNEQRMAASNLVQFDHFSVGMELARRWSFPESIQTAIGFYDTPQEHNWGGQIVHAAVLIANGIQSGETLTDMMNALPPEISSRFNLNKDWFLEQSEVFDVLMQEAAALV